MKHPPMLSGRHRLALGVALLAVIAVIALAAMRPGTPPPSAAMSEVTHGTRGKRQIALTFDAGGEVDRLPELLAALRQASARGTFFLTGQWVRRNPAEAQEIVRDGHQIGNHTWSHLDLTRLDDAGITAEIERGDAALATLTGHSTRPFWRAPFGATDARVLRVAAGLGFRSVRWSLDSLDSVAPPKSPAFLLARVTGGSDAQLDGAIVLMHVGEPATAEAVPRILADLRGRHFHLVTVSEVLGP